MNILTDNAFTYQKKIWHDQKYVVFWLVFFAAAFEFAFGWLLFEAKFNEIFESVANMLPSSLMNFIGVPAGGTFYGLQLLSFGYSHPLVLISLSLLPLSIPARYISGEIENKTVDLFLTKPINRSTIPIHIFIFLLISIALQSLALFMGTYLSYIFFSLNINIQFYFRVIVVTYLFFVSMGSVAMIIAVNQKERGKALAKSVGLFVILYFLDTIIRLNISLSHLTSFSYFNLFQPGKLLRGEVNFEITIFVLLLIVLIFWILSVSVFSKKDL
jgi:ABC-type transport system involved in multi-copper enzyme maturation permease subunit